MKETISKPIIGQQILNEGYTMITMDTNMNKKNEGWWTIIDDERNDDKMKKSGYASESSALWYKVCTESNEDTTYSLTPRNKKTEMILKKILEIQSDNEKEQDT